MTARARGSNGLRATLTDASIASQPVARIRETIWSKLLTNMSMSVLCLLTGQTARAVRDDPALRDVIPGLLDEANGIAQSCFPDVKRVTRSGPAPDHKPSILQDYELGRAMEIDVLVRAPAAFARAAGLSTPMLDLLAALAIRQARDKGLYQVLNARMLGVSRSLPLVGEGTGGGKPQAPDLANTLTPTLSHKKGRGSATPFLAARELAGRSETVPAIVAPRRIGPIRQGCSPRADRLELGLLLVAQRSV